ncbi:hypothetical protein SNE40_020024 [Patella caerulea]|uniref:Small ribosomal subunit protein bS6m n=1 Tax=Patella caerulea TaxID=87958 RepID=A0AAN8G1Y7_PATCE
MPRYELTLIINMLERAALTNTLKRTCTAIMGNGGVIRNMENLGRKTLPYKISKHGNQHTEANYFLLDVDISTNVIPDLRAYLHRDIDIVRPGILQKDLKFVRPCLEGECNFGELPNPDHERRVWKRKTLKKVNYTKADKTRLNYV